MRIAVWCTYILSGIQESARIKIRAQVLFVGARGFLASKKSSVNGLKYAYDSFEQSFLSGLSLDVIYSKEIINSLSFTRETYTICILRHV